MATDLENTIEYYKELLLYQYINKSKARSTIGLLVSQALVELLPIDLNNAFDLDTALGPQLDILGEYIGFDRIISSPIVRTYFIFNDQVFPYSQSTVGFTDYNSNVNQQYSFYNYIDALGVFTALSDDEYRFLLKLKSLNNVSKYSLGEINSILFSFFGTDVVLFDQMDMSISYFVKPTIARIIQIAKNENILPKPMGVIISGIYSVEDFNQFWKFKDTEYDTGYTIGFSDYNTGWSNSHILSYGDVQ